MISTYYLFTIYLISTYDLFDIYLLSIYYIFDIYLLSIYYLFDIYLLSIYYLFDIYLLSTHLVEDDAVPDLVNLPDLDHAAGHVPGEDNEDGEGYTDIMVMSSLVGVPVPVLGVGPGADLQYSTVQYSTVQCCTVCPGADLLLGAVLQHAVPVHCRHRPPAHLHPAHVPDTIIVISHVKSRG